MNHSLIVEGCARAVRGGRPLDTQGSAKNRWLSLGLICTCSLMMVLDATIVNVALPAIQKDLGFSQSSLAWVVNAYLLTFGGLMLISGRAADLFGRRRVLVSGIALFTVASFVCGLSNSQAMLVIARGVQGIGGSIIGAVALSMIVALFPEDGARAKAMSIWGFVSSGGGTLGVILGGVLTQSASWHWIFLVNVPIGVAALALSFPLLPSIPGAGLGKGLDVAGTLAVVVAPILTVYGVITAGLQGWTSGVVLGCLGVALLVLGAFIVIERRAAAPLVPLGIFHSRTIALTNVLMGLTGAAFFGWFFFSPLYVQHILGYDALQTGMSFLPATLIMATLSIALMPKIVAAFGTKRPLVAGTILFTAGLIWFARAPLGGHFLIAVMPPMLLLGLGAGLTFIPLALIATERVESDQAGLVSGLLSTSQMIGGAIGLAVLASLALQWTAGLAGGGQPSTAALNQGYHLAFWIAAAVSVSRTFIAWSQIHPAPAEAGAGSGAANFEGA
jgi:EmrB/QacA subfamily drug resistance transporter